MDITWLQFLLLALATYRLARMVSRELGPFWIFKHFRRIVKREAPKKAHLDDGIECVLCMSLQFGILIAVSACFFLGHPVYDVCILALAVSGAAVIVNQFLARGK